MNMWRMSFRSGNQGPKMWPFCLQYKVAAITYKPIEHIDFNLQTREQQRNLLKRLAPAQQASFKRFVQEVQPEDTIYVKEGKRIICKGKVVEGYKYDYQGHIQDPDGDYWNHQMKVDWDLSFVPVDILTGAEQFTVKPLSETDIIRINEAIKAKKTTIKRMEVLEGGLSRAEMLFRRRNRVIIAAKKAQSNGRCEICNFDFKSKYGLKHKDHLVAHHLEPIGLRNGPSQTTLDDIALLCPNCHTAVHSETPPLSPDRLRIMIERRGDGGDGTRQ